MKNNIIIIQASARSNGDTATIINYISKKKKVDIVDLKNKSIGHFDYDFHNVDDDFIPLMEEIISNYDIILFATPVYWYSMSGYLKVFFDRISDLLKTHKDLGRRLRGKKMAMISVSNHNDLKEGFAMPFKESANYLGMEYLGDLHTWIEEDGIPKKVQINMDSFLNQLS